MRCVVDVEAARRGRALLPVAGRSRARRLLHRPRRSDRPVARRRIIRARVGARRRGHRRRVAGSPRRAPTGHRPHPERHPTADVAQPGTRLRSDVLRPEVGLRAVRVGRSARRRPGRRSLRRSRRGRTRLARTRGMFRAPRQQQPRRHARHTERRVGHTPSAGSRVRRRRVPAPNLTRRRPATAHPCPRRQHHPRPRPTMDRPRRAGDLPLQARRRVGVSDRAA